MRFWDEDGWIPAKEAREMLKIGQTRLHTLWKQGKIRRKLNDDTRRVMYWYSVADIKELLKQSRRRRLRVGKRLKECDLLSETEWLSTKQAAEWIGVHVTRVWILIQRRVLGCRREETGKRVRLWLSRREVEMYLADPERKACRQQYEKVRKGKAATVPEVTELDKEMFAIKEWMTVKKAALYLGISRVTLYGYYAKFRIPGYRLGSSTDRTHRIGFRKEDLDRLLNDPQY